MSARQPASTVQTSEPSRARSVAASAPASSLSGLPGNQAMQALHRSGAARAKLEIGGVDDPQEREVDAVAEKVMRSPDGACCSSCDKGGGCEDDGETVRRSPASVGRGGGALSGHGESSLRRAVGGGEALPRSLRGFFEPRLGRDLGDVKIHRGPDADRASRSIGARAFALGRNIAFADGQWAPETSSGRRLIAHELAHVAAGHGAVRRAPEAAGMTSKSAPASIAAPQQVSSEAAPKEEDLPFGIPPYKGRVLSRDPKQMRNVLKAVTADEGLRGAKIFVGEITGPPANSKEPWVAFMRTGGRFADIALGVIAIANQELAELEKEARVFADRFEGKAKDQARYILDQSEIRIKSEQQRYGILSERDTVRLAPFADQAAKKSLSSAALDLSGKRKILDDLVARQDGLLVPEEINDHDSAGGVPRLGKPVLPEDKRPEFEAIGRQIKAARTEVNLVRGDAESRHPILAAYSAEGVANTRALAAMGAGPDAGLGILTKTINDRLNDIAQVRLGLDNDKVDVWKSATIFNGTKRQLEVEPKSWQDRVLEDRRADGKSLELDDLLFTAVAISLGLLAAIPTAGASIGVVVAVGAAQAATVALSAYEVVEAVRDYQLEQAQTGTDFDKARAISQEDPSLFWLGVSVVGLILDIKDASRVFREVAPLVRRALAAEGEQALRDSLKELAESSAAKRVPDVVERVKARYGAADEVARRERNVAARELERKAATEAETRTQVLSEARTASGHSVKVTRSGWLVRCSECMTIRSQYARELEGSLDFSARLQNAENLAAQAATASAAQDAARAKTLADQSRQIAESLSVDLDAARRARVIERPRTGFRSHGVRLALDPAETTKALRTVEANLKKTGLDSDAVTRILGKSPHVDLMRGQMVEELHAMDVEKLLGKGAAGRTKLLGKDAPAAVEFIAGHRLLNDDRRQITDGILAVVDHEQRVIRGQAISEAKAGADAAEGLTGRKTKLSSADKRRGANREYDEISARAKVEERPGPSLTKEEWAKRFTDKDELRHLAEEEIARLNRRRLKKGEPPTSMTVEDMMDELRKDDVQVEAGGQPRSVLERAIGNVADDNVSVLPKYVYLDGAPYELRLEGKKFLLATPADVKIPGAPEALKNEGIEASVRTVGMKEADVTKAFEPIATLVEAAKAAFDAAP